MTVTRGRIDKRQAILDAAFTVFARDGYRQAGVDTVAAAAGVAKHTVYNHFGDKQSLFRAAIEALADDALTRNLTALEALRVDRDADASLTEVGRNLAICYCDEKSWALRRLLYAELASMPDLQDIVRSRATDKVNNALADRLARLALAGKLRIKDPAVAAEQFGALLTAPLEARSRLGTRKIPASELNETVWNAVQTFLRAFGPDAR
ncbi:TetR/AcrR family transcriptional regulator [Kribbella hippodromi]|uniref:TetR/AcrR family transcriptional regulator n=1 Tax=Kribbella hippodromi TaxID=434347 RepID=UPI0031D8D05C